MRGAPARDIAWPTLLLLLAVVAPVGAQSRSVDVVIARFRALAEARMQTEALLRRCVAEGFVANAIYAGLTRREAFARADEFIATHQARLAVIERCADDARGRLDGYRQTLAEARAGLPSLPGVSAARAAETGDLLQRSYDNLAGFSGDATTRIASIHRGYLAFFRGLKSEAPGDDAPLRLPAAIAAEEGQLLRGARSQVRTGVMYLDAMTTLFPSPALRGRLAVTRVLERVYQAVDRNVEDGDATARAARLREVRQDLRTAEVLARAAAADEAVTGLWPGIAEPYATLIAALTRAQDNVAALEEALGAVAPSTPAGLAERRRRAGEVARQLEGALTTVDRMAAAIDEEISRLR
ncbi:MAG: hypothetical protein HY294_16550 [Candidatus Rokubacteria bacterium]|nr:hypothetical protein [Candidatus Rokubacteria bacterium]